MNWSEFYDRFYDWADSTKISKMYLLENFGDESEVAEIINEYSFIGKKEATRFLKRALSMGVKFSPENIVEMMHDIDDAILFDLAKTHTTPFSESQLLDLSFYLGDEEIDFLAGNEKKTPALEKKTSVSANKSNDIKKKKAGFFRTFFRALCEIIKVIFKMLGVFFVIIDEFLKAIFSSSGASQAKADEQHNRVCDGDCANCPDHYGYRHGRWYYGHDHIEGCEFDGNKGGGSM